MKNYTSANSHRQFISDFIVNFWNGFGWIFQDSFFHLLNACFLEHFCSCWGTNMVLRIWTAYHFILIIHFIVGYCGFNRMSHRHFPISFTSCATERNRSIIFWSKFSPEGKRRNYQLHKNFPFSNILSSLLNMFPAKFNNIL